MFSCLCVCVCVCSPQFVEYQNYVRDGGLKENPLMQRSIALCNGISQWVQLMVLSRPTAPLRAEVFTKFIHVAKVPQDSTLTTTLPEREGKREGWRERKKERGR